ncbi:unnamed protein product [Allacma fusca]|uniref:C2H2-type domain-containing protein n=1 Tax=Allacma fusca TaxID=39272 RepID=A0A8J2K4K0_9HEXA|nr:unnamed protein product [Allacma fusca]
MEGMLQLADGKNRDGIMWVVTTRKTYEVENELPKCPNPESYLKKEVNEASCMCTKFDSGPGVHATQRMNRYRRSSQKSTHESIQNSCNGLYVTSTSDSVSRKPNIISKKSSLRKVIHGTHQSSIVSSQQRSSKVMQTSEDSLRVVVPAVGQDVHPFDSNVYFMLEDGSVMVENASVSQPIVDDFQLKTVSDHIANPQNSMERQLDVEYSEVNAQSVADVKLVPHYSFARPHNEVPTQADILKPGCVQSQQSPVKLIRAAEELDSSKDFREVEPQRHTNSTQLEEYQNENQYIILQMGSQTLLVPITTFQQYCDAQQNGDAQNVAVFFSQIEQALLDSNADVVTGVENFRTALTNSVHNGSHIQPNEIPSSLALKKEVNAELPLPALVDGTSPSIEPTDSKFEDINNAKITSTEPYRYAEILTNGSNNECDKEEPPFKKIKEAKEVGTKSSLLSGRQLAAKSETKSTKKENINIFRCGTCTMLFATKDLCMQHIYVVHKADPLKTQCDLRRTNETRFICHGCSRTYGSLAEFHKHNLLSHGSESTITKDKVICKSDVNLVPVKSNDQCPYKTVVLDNDETKKEINVSHQARQTSNLNYPDSFNCSKCSKTFVSLFYYLIHGLLHMETTEGWVCQICSEGFSSKSKLVEHFRVHCEIERYSDINSEGLVVKTENGDCVKEYSKVPGSNIVNINKDAKKSGESKDCGGTTEMYKGDHVLRGTGRKNVQTAGGIRSSLVNNSFISADSGNNGPDTTDNSAQRECTAANPDSKPQCGPDVEVMTTTTTSLDLFQTVRTDLSIPVSHSESAKEAKERYVVKEESQEGQRTIIDGKISSAAEKLTGQNSGGRLYEISTEDGTNCNSWDSKGSKSSSSPEESLKNVVSHQGYGNEKSKAGEQIKQTGTRSQGDTLSRALRSRQQCSKLKEAGNSSSPSAAATACNSSTRKVNTRSKKTVNVEKNLLKEVLPDLVTGSTVRRTQRSSCQKKANIVKSVAQKSYLVSSKDEIGLHRAKIGRKSSTANTPEMNPLDTRKVEENGRRSGPGEHSNDNCNVKGSRSAKKEDIFRLRSRSIVCTESKGKPKRVRKDATTSRELLPEDGPKFELSSAKSKSTPSVRKKRGVHQPEQLGNPDNRSRVQQSFIEIFNQVKSTGETVKDRRNK